MTSSNPGRDTHRRTYWRAVLRRTVLLLAIWFAAGPLLGVLFADRLNAIALAGLPLGFWMAQQGAIYVFVVLIFVYAWLADRADAGQQGAGARHERSAASGRLRSGADSPRRRAGG